MFMKLEDFKSLCRKYGLVCGCINEFSGEIPDKNLKEMEAALEIINNTSDYDIQSINKEYYTFSSIFVVDDKTKYFKEKFNKLKDDIILFHFHKIIGDVFFNKTKTTYLLSRPSAQPGIYADKEAIPSNRMLIAATSNLMGRIEINYEEAPAPNPLIKDDLIVFQLLPYDIVMIHSKWGDEASDPILEERKL